MFYETAQTVGPGWHSSFKPSHYEDMSWSPSSRNFRSPGSSPETYRRIIRTEEDFPDRNPESTDDFFKSNRRSPTFPRRIFKEFWNDSPSSNHQRFSERPRLFKRVFRPNHFDDDFESDAPHLHRFEREFDDSRPSSRRFDEDFDRHFNARNAEGDEKFGREGKVHHIPILVERRMEDLRSRFGRKSPPPDGDQEYPEDFSRPQVQRLKKNFEPEEGFSTRHRSPKPDTNFKSRMFAHIPETWDPHAVHTLPTRKMHKASQSFDDCRHAAPPKNVFRSYSETHEEMPKSQQPHSAAFRSHSDGHCPNQTYITKVEVKGPDKGSKEKCNSDELGNAPIDERIHVKRLNSQPTEEESPVENAKPKGRAKYDSPSMQQIAVVLQNVEDLVTRIEAYSGTGRDKQFRFLDEMLTRCMLRLDDIDTEGSEEVRNARKAAIREVQNCVDRLEAKAEESERSKMAKPKPEAKTNHQGKETACIANESKAAIPMRDTEPADIAATSNKAILLQDSSGIAIPLGDSSNSAIPLADTVIPLGDIPKAAIPLGDVPRTVDGGMKANKEDISSVEEKENMKQNGDVNAKGEQTKL